MASVLVQTRERVLATLPFVVAIVLVAAAFYAASRYIEPAPPTRLVIATASKGSPYYKLAERYHAVLAQNGITLDIRETTGSIENLKLIKDGASGVQAAILQGGIAGGTDKAGLLSLGRIAYEPVWVFYRGEAQIGRLSELKGKRVLVGPAGGGTNFLATRILAANGVTAENTRIVSMELPDYVDALAKGEADAGFLVLAPDARTLQRLFALPDVKLMSMTHAEALAQRFPYLSRVELKQGIVDFDRNIPPVDTAMVATLEALVVRDDLHPALANLLTQAVVEVNAQPVVGPNGEAPIFQRIAEFPIQTDPEFPMSDEATRVYKSGTPFLQRFMPFWLATLVDRLRILALPIIGVLLPAIRLGPMLYSWQVRRRLLYWYKELKRVERGITPGAGEYVIAQKQAEVEQIEDAVNQIAVPLAFSNQHFDLRQHIDVVRRRLASLATLAHDQPHA